MTLKGGRRKTIVEMKKVGNDIKLYGITPFGKEILQTIREK